MRANNFAENGVTHCRSHRISGDDQDETDDQLRRRKTRNKTAPVLEKYRTSTCIQEVNINEYSQ